MQNNTGKVIEAWAKSGIIGKILIAFLAVFVLLCVILFIFYDRTLTTFQNHAKSIKALVVYMTEIDKFKRCMKDALDKADENYNEKLLPYIGELLKKHTIPFPQELNLKLLNYQKEFKYAYDCLIFPEDMK